MLEIIVVGLGGSSGAIARYIISAELASKYGTVFPFGTLLVNIVGSFILATLAGLLSRGLLAEGLYRELIGVGFCGGLTTFSTFSNETLSLWYNQKIYRALLNLASNFTLALLATGGGFWLGVVL